MTESTKQRKPNLQLLLGAFGGMIAFALLVGLLLSPTAKALPDSLLGHRLGSVIKPSRHGVCPDPKSKNDAYRAVYCYVTNSNSKLWMVSAEYTPSDHKTFYALVEARAKKHGKPTIRHGSERCSLDAYTYLGPTILVAEPECAIWDDGSRKLRLFRIDTKVLGFMERSIHISLESAQLKAMHQREQSAATERTTRAEEKKMRIRAKSLVEQE